MQPLREHGAAGFNRTVRNVDRAGRRHNLALSWCLPLVVQTIAAGVHAQEPGLILEEVQAFPIPANFAATALAAPNQRIQVYLGQTPPYVMIVRDGAVVPHPSISIHRPVGIAFVDGDSVFEVLDRDGAAVYALDTRGNVLSSRRIRLESDVVEIVEAIRLRTLWCVLARDTVRNEYHLLREDKTEPLMVFSPRSAGMQPVRISAGDSLLLATEVEYPYTVHAIDRDGNAVHTFGPADPTGIVGRDVLDSRVSVYINSLPVIAIPSGFIQTIADLRDDERWIVAFSPDRRMLSSRRLHIAVAFVGTTSTTPRQLIAVRDLGVRELVFYAYNAWNGKDRARNYPYFKES